MESDEDLSRFRVLDETTVLRHLKRRYLADECYVSSLKENPKKAIAKTKKKKKKKKNNNNEISKTYRISL